MIFYLYYYFTGWKEVFENLGCLLILVAGFVLLGDIIDTR